jgi:hypothetical protein
MPIRSVATIRSSLSGVSRRFRPGYGAETCPDAGRLDHPSAGTRPGEGNTVSQPASTVTPPAPAESKPNHGDLTGPGAASSPPPASPPTTRPPEAAHPAGSGSRAEREATHWFGLTPEICEG